MEPVWVGNEQLPGYQDGHLAIDFAQRVVTLDSRALVLTSKEYALLTLLAANAGEIVSRSTLLLTVWGYNHEIRTRTLDVHIARLRKKLSSFGHQYLETVFRNGCRFQPCNGAIHFQPSQHRPAFALSA